MADLTALNAHICIERGCNVRERAIHSYTQNEAKKAADAEKAALDKHQANVRGLATKLAAWGVERVDDCPYTVDGVTFTYTGDGYLHVVVTCTDCGQEAKPTATYWYQLGEWLDIGWSHVRSAKVACPALECKPSDLDKPGLQPLTGFRTVKEIGQSPLVGG